MRALKHPALGLAMLMLGLAGLPAALSAVAQVVILDRGADLPWLSLVLPMFASVVVAALQAATGWAIMVGRRAGVLFALYIAACVALTVVLATVERGDDSLHPSLVLGIAIETLGFPVLIAIASLLYRGSELEESWSFSDVTAALLLIAVHTFVETSINITDLVHISREPSTTVESWAAMLIYPAVWLALGVVAALGSRSKKGAQVYVIVTVAVTVVLAMVMVAWNLIGDVDETVRKFMLISRIVGFISLGVPAALWWYTRTAQVDARRGSRLPLWIALSYVPTLVARIGLSPEMAGQFGRPSATLFVGIGLALAFVLCAAGHTGLRRSPAVRIWGALAALVSLVVNVVALVYVWRSHMRLEAMGTLAPLGNLVASTIILAWRGAA